MYISSTVICIIVVILVVSICAAVLFMRTKTEGVPTACGNTPEAPHKPSCVSNIQEYTKAPQKKESVQNKDKKTSFQRYKSAYLAMNHGENDRKKNHATFLSQQNNPAFNAFDMFSENSSTDKIKMIKLKKLKEQESNYKGLSIPSNGETY